VSRAGVPRTTPARTLVDVAGMYGRTLLQRTVEQAVVHKLLDFPALDLAMDMARGRRGVATLRAIADKWRMPDGSAPDVRSMFEARILPALLAIGFDPPVCNRTLQIGEHQLRPDFYWEKQRVIVETDGEATHGTPVAFRHDRWRDQVLMAAGYRAARVPWDHIKHEPAATIGRLRRILEQATGSG
jgi:hypothetical protein